jgi:hypothetical protein
VTTEELIYKLENEPDFVNVKRMGYSLLNVLNRYPLTKYPNGVPNSLIATALCITEDEVEALYNEAVSLLRAALKVEH